MTDLTCDVLVVGGGIAGVAAATAAARQGSKTILIESKTFVGGVPATGYCLHNFIAKDGRQVVFGLAQEIVDNLIEMGGAVGHVPYKGFVCAVTPIDGEMFRFLSNRLLLIWLTQQTAMGSVERCLGRHFPRPCGSSKATSLPRKRANSTSRPAAGLMASSVRAVKIGELTSWLINGDGSVPVAVTNSR